MLIASASGFGVLSRKACGTLAPWLGTQPAAPALEGEVLTTDCQGNPQPPPPGLGALLGAWGMENDEELAQRDTNLKFNHLQEQLYLLWARQNVSN